MLSPHPPQVNRQHYIPVFFHDYIYNGLTRNFEALQKAEREQEARIEELENNPMMLLEENVDEMWELDRRRTGALNHETMLPEEKELHDDSDGRRRK